MKRPSEAFLSVRFRTDGPSDPISFNRRGEIRDRNAEGQHYRVAGMNLLAAAIIHWNTRALGTVIANMAANGEAPDPEAVARVSPLGWEHINLAGEYRWPSLE